MKNLRNLAAIVLLAGLVLVLLFSAAPSGNYRWVYEYDWNGRNDEGEEVAPGLYFYRVNADGKIKVGKLAVAR